MVLTPAWRDPPILGLMVGQILVWSAFFYSFPALAPIWQAEFGWSLPQIMGAFSLALFAMALTTPIAGQWVDRGFGARLLSIAPILGAVALASVAMGPTLTGFYIAWAVIGLCMGATLYEPTFAVLLRTRGDQARPAITAISVVAGFASLLTFPTVHWLAQTIGWQAAPWLFALLLVLVAAPCLGLSAMRLEADRIAPAAPANAAANTQQSRAGFRRLVVIFLLPALTSGLVLSQILPLLTGVGYSTETAVALAALMGPMQVLARLATSFAFKASTQIIVMVALLSLSAGALAIWAGAPGLLAAIAFVVAFGTGNGLVGILRPIVVREVLGAADVGALTGAVARPALLAVAAAPLIGAVVLAQGGPTFLLLIAAAAPLVAALLFYRIIKHAT